MANGSDIGGEYGHPHEAGASASARAEAHARELSPRELLVLQLAARAYTPEQIAKLLTLPPAEVLATLTSIAESMGAGTDWRAAVAQARNLRLIV